MDKKKCIDNIETNLAANKSLGKFLVANIMGFPPQK